MPDDPQSPPRVPLGPPLPWSDADLDALSEITPEDVSAAQGWVERNATTSGRRLWAGEEVE